MKYLLIIGLLGFQINAYSQTKKTGPLSNKEEVSKIKQVTISGLLKNLNDMFLHSNRSEIEIIFAGRTCDATILKYDGGNYTEIKIFFERYSTENDFVHFKTKNADLSIPQQSFRIKK